MNVEAMGDGRANDRLLIVSPVFDDWASAARLVQELDALALDARTRVLFVDDGSRVVASPPPEWRLAQLEEVSTLRLYRNLGHQRAIAVGLAFAREHFEFDAVVVMDSDGEDAPGDVARLLDAFRTAGSAQIVFAERRRRSETWSFKAFYVIYLATFRTLAGFAERTGNFSIVPGALVERLVVASELWMHYSSAVVKLRIPYGKVSTDRGVRYVGRSQMNVTSLIIHGLQAIAVHREVVAVRVFLFCLVSALIVGLGFFAVFVVRFTTDLAIPGWATNVAGILAVLFGQILSLGLFSIFLVLGSRSAMEVIPIRDYAVFVRDRVINASKQPSAADADR